MILYIYILYVYNRYINILLNTSYAPQIPWFISHHIPSKCSPLKGSETKTGDLSSQARAYANCGKWQAEKSYSMAAGAKWFVLQGDLGHFPRSPEKWAIDSWKMFDFFGRPRKSKCLEDPFFLNGKKLCEHRNNA